MKSNQGVIVFDVGGTYIKACLIDSSIHQVIKPFEVPSFANEDYEKFLDSVQIIYQNILDGNPNLVIEALLFTMPGPFDYKNGISYMKHKFQSLYEKDLRSLLKIRLGYNGDILFENDAIAFLYSALHGQNINENSIAITLGTGLGYVVYENGTVERSDLGSPKEVLYNAPYLGKAMEEYFSARGLLSFYHGNRKYENSLDLYNAATANDKYALSSFSDFGRELGKALKPYLDRHSAKCLIIGGQVAKSYPYFLPDLKDELKGVKILVRTEDCPSLFGLAYEYYKNKI